MGNFTCPARIYLTYSVNLLALCRALPAKMGWSSTLGHLKKQDKSGRSGRGGSACANPSLLILTNARIVLIE